ncbi:MAG: hypothetical protein H6Q35_1358 [Proteobacteria bacterium]|nr:hypothetical protein [Pseudomonadota bacterium]
MNRVFYKYRSDSKYTEDIFTTGKVYLSTAEGLNDPFECSLQDIGHTWIEEQILKLKKAAVSGFVYMAVKAKKSNGDFYGLSLEEIQKLLNMIKGHVNLDESYDLYAKFIMEKTGHYPSNPLNLFLHIDRQLNAVGIFSLSCKPDHPLMWAHYGNSHTGICIGFSNHGECKLSNEKHFLPIIYSDELPLTDKNGFNTEMTFAVDENFKLYVSGYEVAFSDKTFQKAITTKHTCWSYEEEWRYVEPFGGLFEWPGDITEIIFGMLCPDERIKHYIELVEAHVPNEVALFKIRKIQGANKIEKVPYDIVVTKPKLKNKLHIQEEQQDKSLTEVEFMHMIERLVQQKKYGDALFQIDENLKTKQDTGALIHLKGVVYGYAGEHNKALQCFAKLIDEYPDIASGWYHVSCALVELGRHDEAVRALKKAFTLDPNDASIAFNLGVELLRTEDSNKNAIEYLRKADKLGHRRAYDAIQQIENPSD